ncbi:MAG TPA: tannase/feruloyl esterase family alpha/beta hydrolase [Bryobacteraceae bacterium]|nr:tannase/feruloyl esterase family alpha/beta hydrolase [Bryobacteraceae bacterium]
MLPSKLRLVLSALLATPLVAATCESLSALKPPDTTITAASTVAAGAFTPPAGPQLGQAPVDYKALPAFCRVQGVIQPSADSHIEFEIWLPASGWNGRYEGLGNGGFAGSIDFGGMGNALANGYVASATDTGHKGSAIDGKWAAGHPEKITDFGYRAIHETAEKAKAITAAFYGNGARHSYFSSCSDGGREALMEAQRFPGDYDGILAGAPANNWTPLLSSGMADVLTLSDSASYIPAAKLPAIQAATLAACDAQDGVKDGLIGDPSKCKFDPAVLLCKSGDSDSCLTAPQVAALQQLYSAKLNFPGKLPGGEVGPNTWGDWITGAAPGRSLMFAFGTGFFGNFVYDDPAWDFHTFQGERASKLADDKLARALNATDPDLKRFRDHGGKLIIYHGWSDAAISALNSINYLKSVQQKMGNAQTADFVRLYLAPGMAHCGGGPGPDSFGQGSVAPAEPQHSITKALEDWVEKGTAPASLIATKYKAGTPASGVARTRPLCPYPQVAQYRGSGSTDDAANFACVEAK